jgi:hypothetical protein
VGAAIAIVKPTSSCFHALHKTQNAAGVRKFQPRVGACDNPGGDTDNNSSTLKAFAKDRAFANTFSVEELYFLLTQGCSNPGLKFANSVGVLLQESRCIVEPPQSQAQSSSLCGTPINVEVVTLPVYVVAVERPAPTYL